VPAGAPAGAPYGRRAAAAVRSSAPESGRSRASAHLAHVDGPGGRADVDEVVRRAAAHRATAPRRHAVSRSRPRQQGDTTATHLQDGRQAEAYSGRRPDGFGQHRTALDAGGRPRPAHSPAGPRGERSGRRARGRSPARCPGAAPSRARGVGQRRRDRARRGAAGGRTGGRTPPAGRTPHHRGARQRAADQLFGTDPGAKTPGARGPRGRIPTAPRRTRAFAFGCPRPPLRWRVHQGQPRRARSTTTSTPTPPQGTEDV
jgi:hypothetical protein